MQKTLRFAYSHLFLSSRVFCSRILVHGLCIGSLLATSLACAEPEVAPTKSTKSVASTNPLDEGWDEDDADPSEGDDVPISQIRKFIETFQIVKNNYVAGLSDDELFENAIHGLVEGLDPYSRYLDSAQYKQLMQFTEGQIARPDFQVQYDKLQQVWQISAVPLGSEAYRAGLRSGQILERINKVKVQDLDSKLLNQLMVGSLGSLMKVDIKSGQGSKSFDIVRDKKEEYDIQPYLTDEKILVLKIKAFQKETTQQVQEILALYQGQAEIKGVLIDLRDNPGGLLAAAVELADLFLEQGLIVSTKGRLEAPQRFQALPSNQPIQYPLAILQNRYSASAAEVFAAALKEQNRAIIIGERSYGKGAIQKLFPLEQGALQLTVAYYYTPQGHLIEGKGIEPNEALPILKSHTEEEILHQAVKVFHQIVMPKNPNSNANLGTNGSINNSNISYSNTNTTYPNYNLKP